MRLVDSFSVDPGCPSPRRRGGRAPPWSSGVRLPSICRTSTGGGSLQPWTSGKQGTYFAAIRGRNSPYLPPGLPPGSIRAGSTGVLPPGRAPGRPFRPGVGDPPGKYGEILPISRPKILCHFPHISRRAPCTLFISPVSRDQAPGTLRVASASPATAHWVGTRSTCGRAAVPSRETAAHGNQLCMTTGRLMSTVTSNSPRLRSYATVYGSLDAIRRTAWLSGNV